MKVGGPVPLLRWSCSDGLPVSTVVVLKVENCYFYSSLFYHFFGLFLQHGEISFDLISCYGICGLLCLMF